MLSNDEAISIMYGAVVVIVKLCGPLLLISMAIGVLISILQAATQIHEQTITFVPKLITLGIVMLACGSWMLETVQGFTYQIFELMK